MSKWGRRLATVLIVAGAAILLLSLFLAWSHQIPAGEHARFRGAVLFGVAANPTAWQVYAIAGEVLAALAVAVLAAGLLGQRPVRAVALAGVAVALAFVVHALSVPPTNGVLLSAGMGAATRYVSDPATAGAGESVALIGLIVQAAGLTLRFLVDEPTI